MSLKRRTPEEDQDDSDYKKVKLDVPLESIQMQHLHRTMINSYPNDGTPFTLPLSNHLFTCCIWTSNSDQDLEELGTAFKLSEQYPNIYLPLQYSKLEKDATTVLFNQGKGHEYRSKGTGLYHHSLEQYVESIYVPSIGYAPLEMSNR
jgi:hypothetical protein